MRAYIVFGGLLLAACSNQQPAAPEPSEQPRVEVSRDWDCEKNNSGMWACHPAATRADPPATVEEPAPTAEAAPEPPLQDQPAAAPVAVIERAAASEPSPAAAADSSESYVLQVGAFRTRELAETAASQITLEELRIIPTRRDGEDWYVLVLGAYHSSFEAREAGQAYMDAFPTGTIWVREAADLKQSLIIP